MRSIGGLLQRGRPGEQQEFAAAFIVGAVNDALRMVLQLDANDARAISFSRGTVMIGVSHGAVAGSIQRSAAAIIDQTNKKIITAGGRGRTINKIITRPQTPRSP